MSRRTELEPLFHPGDEPPAQVLHVIRTLNEAGHAAHLVGGCVRDLLLGRVPHDWDVCTDAIPEHVALLFEKTVPTGLRHGTITIVLGSMHVEVTTWRTDSVYSDRRRPDSVTFTRSLHEDLLRRDFTINAMAWHPAHGLTDPAGGRQDLATGIIRCVGDPFLRFDEDALRMMRAIRFAAELGFRLDEATWKAIETHADAIRHVSGERVLAEFRRILWSPSPEELFRIWDCGMSRNALPFGRPSGPVRETLLALRAAKAPEAAYWAAVIFFTPDSRSVYNRLPAGIPDYRATQLVKDLHLDRRTAHQADRMLSLLPHALCPTRRNLRWIQDAGGADAAIIQCMAAAARRAAGAEERLPKASLLPDAAWPSRIATDPGHARSCRTAELPPLPGGHALMERFGLAGRQISDCLSVLRFMRAEAPECLSEEMLGMLLPSIKKLLS